MKGHIRFLKAPSLVLISLFTGKIALMGQVALPVATALRFYDQGFREPVRLATDADGRLYTTDPRMGIVTVRDEAGRLQATKRGLAKPLGVAVEASGRIFVCEAGRGRVSIFTPGWVPAGALGQGDGEFRMPNHIQIAPDGLIYVVDSTADRIKVFGNNGVLIRQFGGHGAQAGQFDFPTGIAVTPGGEIFVSDLGNERIQVFDLNGAFVRAFGEKNQAGTDSTFGRVQGILADAQGRIYLADSFRSVVTVVTGTGDRLGAIGTLGSNLGQLMGPASLALDRNNRLFVAAPGNSRVEVFGLDAYTDPHLLFATVKVSPSRIKDDGGEVAMGGPLAAISKAGSTKLATPKPPPMIEVLIKVPGVNPAAMLDGVLTANGISPYKTTDAAVGDFDGDGQLEYRAWFNRKSLAATLPDGEAFLVVSGRLSDGRTFESIANVTAAHSDAGAQ
jgi:DNA-binding beta-propeller fold protein YncE